MPEHRQLLPGLVALISALASIPVVLAHHGTFTFDGDTVITLEGHIVRFNWTNPHGSVVLGVPQADGSIREYFLEADGPSILGPLGVSRDSLLPGDQVLAYVSPGRDPDARSVLGREILKTDGTVVGLSVAYTRKLERENQPVASSVIGTWVPDQRALFSFVQSRDNWPLTEAGAQSLASYDILAPFTQTECIAATSPTVLMYPTAKVLTDNGSSLTLNADWMGAVRTVYMDGRAHPQPAETSLQGHSIGHLEDGILVIDTTGFSDNPIGNIFGIASGPLKHLVERLALAADGRSLDYSFTLEDSTYLQAPVSGSYTWLYRPDVVASTERCDVEVASRHLTE